MRKFLLIVLVIVFITSFTACSKKGENNMENNSDQNTSVSSSKGEGVENSSEQSQNTSVSTSGGDVSSLLAPSRVIATTGGVSEKRTLANTYKCLTEKKQLNILYIGGSLTVGTGSTNTECWRAYTTKWLKETYPDAAINEKNVAVGGTGSLFGLARTKRDVIAHKPDLVFIEFAVNDDYLGLTEAQAATYMEGMVRQINEALPSTDIIFVLTTDRSRVGKTYITRDAHIKIADFYGVPYIDAGAALVEPVKATSWTEYAVDVVHLNAKGYRFYADEVIKNLKMLLADAKGKAGGAHKFPAGFASSNPATTVTLMGADAIAALNSKDWRSIPGKAVSDSGQNCAMPQTTDATIKFEFDGTVLSVVGQKSAGGEVIFTIDGVVAKKLNNAYTKEGFITVVDNLKPGHHTVEIKVTAKCLKIDGFMVG